MLCITFSATTTETGDPRAKEIKTLAKGSLSPLSVAVEGR